MKLKNFLQLILVLSIAVALPSNRIFAQAPTDIDKLFDDDEDEDPVPGAPPNRGAQQPPPPPPAPMQNNNPPDNGNAAGFPADNIRGGGVNSFSPKNNAQRSKGASQPASRAQVAVPTPTPAKTTKPFKDASIEEITNENYPDEIESFDYPNAEITDVVKAISDLTGKNFIVDPQVHGKISIIAPSKITVAEAYKAFLAALAINGFTVVPYGKFLKVKSSKAAEHDSIPTYSGAYYPTSDIYVTRIIHLKHISADDVQKNLRTIATRDGEVIPYPPTNSLIINDYGTNVEKISKIIEQLDQPGFDEQLAVIPIKHAKSKDLADLINAIINKDPTKGAQNGGFGVPRYRTGGVPATGSTGAENLSLVTPDERTNAIIVVGNEAGVEKVRNLVRKLDYKLDPSEGGVFVYFVRYGEADKIAQTLSGVAAVSGAASGSSTPGAAGGGGFGGFPQTTKPPGERTSIFGGDVKIAADKANNSLVITASKQDYDIVKNILAKIDVPRDQVFVEAIIMEMNSSKNRTWDSNIVKFQEVTNPLTPGQPTAGPARSGFTGGNLNNLLNPAAAGGIIGFGSGDTLTLTLGSQTVQIPSLLALISFLQTQNQGNILSTPQILALDNEEATIEVGSKIPISQNVSTTANGQSTASTNLEEVNISLKLTPHISPDSDQVRMKLLQEVKQPVSSQGQAQAFVGTTTVVAKRKIETNIVVNSADTAVLGGLVHDSDSIQETKVPILGDLPIIGWLFKSSSIAKEKQNLVVFLTPKILRNSKDNHELLNGLTEKRIDWLKKNFDGRDPYGKVIEELPRAEVPETLERTKKND